MAVALVVMFVLFIESDRIIPLLYGPHYLEAVWLQKVLVVTVVFAFLHNLAAFLMISMRLPAAPDLLPGRAGCQSALVLPGHAPGPADGRGPGHGGH